MAEPSQKSGVKLGMFLRFLLSTQFGSTPSFPFSAICGILVEQEDDGLEEKFKVPCNPLVDVIACPFDTSHPLKLATSLIAATFASKTKRLYSLQHYISLQMSANLN